jgi:hypothetical protein
MFNATREQIFAALFAAASATQGLAFKQRRVLSFDDVSYANMPALFQLEHDQRAEWRHGMPQRWTLQAELIIYSDQRSDQKDGPQGLNALIDGIEAALAPDNSSTGCCTLGGLVTYCRISEVKIYEGVQTGTAVAILSIEILTI